jgi:transposase InsO family protein
MLGEAFAKHPSVEGLVFHSDQGWQYRMRQHGRMPSGHGASQSMPGKGNCLDNPIMEAFFATMKGGMLCGHEPDFKTFGQFREAVAECIRWYNPERIQSKTKWMPPLRFREASIGALRYESANFARKLGSHQKMFLEASSFLNNSVII